MLVANKYEYGLPLGYLASSSLYLCIILIMECVVFHLCFSFLLPSLHLDDITLGGERRGDVLDIVLALVGDQVDVVRQDQGRQDKAHLHHGKILAYTVACAGREGVERKVLNWREGRLFGDPALGDVLFRLWEVLVGPV